MKKLWQKTALSIVVSGVLVTLIVIAVAGLTVFRMEKGNIENQMETRTRVISLSLDKVFEQGKGLLEAVAVNVKAKVDIYTWENLGDVELSMARAIGYELTGVAEKIPAAEEVYFYFNSAHIGQKDISGVWTAPVDGKIESEAGKDYSLGKDGFEDGNPDFAWYFDPVVRQKSGWTEPSVEEGSYDIGYTFPVVRGEVVIGVLGMDFATETINRHVRDYHTDEGAFAFILSPEGRVIAHHALDTATGEMPEADRALIDSLGKALVTSEAGTVFQVGDNFVDYQTIQDGLRVGYVVPRAVLMAPVWAMIWRISLFSLIGLLLAGILGMAFGKRLTRPIVEVSEVAARMGEGDLREVTFSFQTKDEVSHLQQAVGKTLTDLRKMMVEIRSMAEHLSASSQEVAAGAEEAGKGAESSTEQIRKLVQVISDQGKSVEKLSGFVLQGGEAVKNAIEQINALEGNQKNQKDITEQGALLVQETEKSVGSLREISEEVNTSFRQVTESMKKIVGMADTISGIADQTNLLALNAAIEAARAGDAGRGFAVVAEEVRKLAEESARAARQIHGNIGEIQPRIAKAETALQEADTVTTEGTRVARSTGQAFETIMASVNNAQMTGQTVAGALEDLARVYQDIEKELDDVNEGRHAVGESTDSLSASAEEQSAQAEEFAASSQALSDMAEKLTGEVVRFRTE